MSDRKYIGLILFWMGLTSINGLMQSMDINEIQDQCFEQQLGE